MSPYNVLICIIGVVAIALGLWSMAINRRIGLELDDMERRIDRLLAP